ncbi:MAG: hypothetical protein GX226_01465 [Dehalococcoidales bacterium]|jgi:hypothetical protein|nr:hypothetical protein [Dehalococcoidales bacterium]
MSLKTGSILFGLFAVVWIGLGVIIFNADGFNTGRNNPAAITGKHTLTYQVTGTAQTVSVTLHDSAGGIVQYSNVHLPYNKTYNNYDFWFASILAQNMGGSGSVTVSIIVDGQVVKQSTSSGAYVIAMADYSFY